MILRHVRKLLSIYRKQKNNRIMKKEGKSVNMGIGEGTGRERGVDEGGGG